MQTECGKKTTKITTRKVSVPATTAVGGLAVIVQGRLEENAMSITTQAVLALHGMQADGIDGSNKTRCYNLVSASQINLESFSDPEYQCGLDNCI